MKPAERVTADWLLERGFAPSEVRRQLAVVRPLFARLREKRRAREKEARKEHARLMAEDWNPWPDDNDDLPWDRGDGDGRCADCGKPIDASETICDECVY